MSPAAGRLAELPRAQREALETAFGRRSGTPDPFRIGVAVLGLRASAARPEPVLCLVDDAQWLDAESATVLGLVARRLGAEPVAMVLALRTSGAAGALGDLPVVVVQGLQDDAARALVTARSHVPLDVQVRDRIVAEARGNPLALLELLGRRFAPPDTLSVPVPSSAATPPGRPGCRTARACCSP